MLYDVTGTHAVAIGYSSHSLNLMCYGSLISDKTVIQASQNILWFLGARCGRDVWQCWFVMIIGWIRIYNYIYIVHKQNHDNNLRVLCYYASKEVSRQGLRIRSEWTACIAKIHNFHCNICKFYLEEGLIRILVFWVVMLLTWFFTTTNEAPIKSSLTKFFLVPIIGCG